MKIKQPNQECLLASTRESVATLTSAHVLLASLLSMSSVQAADTPSFSERQQSVAFGRNDDTQTDGRITQQVTEKTTYLPEAQNPGAPDEILVNAPDSVFSVRPTKVLVQGRDLLLQQNNFSAPTRSGLESAPIRIFRDDQHRSLGSCVVDFTDEDMLALTEHSLYFDRIYLPWFESCDGWGHVDIRPTIASHFHLSFVDPDVSPCFDSPDAFPSFIDDDGSCNYVDVRTEPRGYLQPHFSGEYLHLRVEGVTDTGWTPFDLNQITIKGNSAARLCYRIEQEVDLDWITTGAEAGTIPGAWLCWNELSPGTWNLSNWAFDVTDVKMTSSTLGVIGIDDLHIGTY